MGRGEHWEVTGGELGVLAWAGEHWEVTGRQLDATGRDCEVTGSTGMGWCTRMGWGALGGNWEAAGGYWSGPGGHWEGGGVGRGVTGR